MKITIEVSELIKGKLEHLCELTGMNKTAYLAHLIINEYEREQQKSMINNMAIQMPKMLEQMKDIPLDTLVQLAKNTEPGEDKKTISDAIKSGDFSLF